MKTWRWLPESGGDWFLKVDGYSAAMLCAHHDDFWTTIINGDRKDFPDRADAIGRIAIDLQLPDLTAPSDVPATPGLVLIASSPTEALMRGVSPSTIAGAIELERKSS